MAVGIDTSLQRITGIMKMLKLCQLEMLDRSAWTTGEALD